MGLILDAACACGFARASLKLGGSHAQIAAHDVSAFEVYRAPCCKDLQSVLIYLGQVPPPTPCATCASALPLEPEDRVRISTMKGEVLAGHACPRCGERRLGFTVAGKFL